MINFYRRFIPQAALILEPLTNLLRGAKKKKEALNWDEGAHDAFEKAKVALAKAARLSYPQIGAKLSIVVDASDKAVGGAMQQHTAEGWKPISFFSQKLKPAEVKYSAYDRELLAIYLAVKHFRHLLEGQHFTIFTDHKPLTYAFQQKCDKGSPRQQRQLDFISQFTTDIQHISGVNNVVADTLSRLEAIDGPPRSIDFSAIAKAQEVDPELRELRQKSSLVLKKVPLLETDTELVCDVKTGNNRPYIPRQFRRAIFENLHGMAHPGIKATSKLISQRFVWPGMEKDIKTWTKACLACQRSKVHRHVKSPVGTINVPDVRFEHIHLDLLGPLPVADNARYCLTLIDRFTRWPEAIPVPDASAETCAKAFFTHWVARFGTPAYVTTDQGRQFEGALFTELNKLIGCKRIRTTAFNPKANGMVERFHRQLKAALRAHDSKWTEALPVVLLGIRVALKEELGASAAELVYGSALRVPGEFFDPTPLTKPASDFVRELRSKMSQLKPTGATSHAKSQIFMPKELDTCSHVFVRVDSIRRPLQQPYEGPYRVLKRKPKHFLLEIKGKQNTVSVDRLKPAFVEQDLSVDGTRQPPTKTKEPHTITRSNRKVYFPDRYGQTN